MNKEFTLQDTTEILSNSTVKNIFEFPLSWPGEICCSTHELVITPEFIYVSGQNMDQIAKFDYNGNVLSYFNMPKGSGPHGLLLDSQNRLWLSLEFHGKVVRLDDNGQIAEEIDVQIYAAGANQPINTAPHGIALDADGETIWFTGKRTSTIGKINPDKSIEHFQLNTLAALPIFLNAGPDGGIWGTELYGSNILNISKSGVVREFPIPTTNSRPIAIIPDPVEPYMWFTEEAGVKIGKISMEGSITEFSVPALQKNDIIASLTFDKEGNLWVQVYVDQNNPKPEGRDYLIKFDKAIRYVEGNDISNVPFYIYNVPSRKTMMHRIRCDYKGDLWFTEMMTDKLGKVEFNR